MSARLNSFIDLRPKFMNKFPFGTYVLFLVIATILFFSPNSLDAFNYPKQLILAAGTFTLKPAISKSCNSYFAVAYRRILDNAKVNNREITLGLFNEYAYSFGLGKKLGVDLPSERMGNIPTSKYYQKIFGKKNFFVNHADENNVYSYKDHLNSILVRN